MKNINQSKVKSKSSQSLGGTPAAVRKRFLLLEALHIESIHLLSNTCPLSEIVIPPVLLPPPLQISPDTTVFADSLVHQVLPYLPDWPEFVAPYSVKHVSIADVLKGGLNIALIGKSGIGKTTALAYLALLIINNSPKVDYLGSPLPLFIHARDIVESNNPSDPMKTLTGILCDYYPEIRSDRLKQITESAFQANEILLMIDGIDELPRNLISECYSFIKNFRNTIKTNFRLLITAPLDYLDGFVLDNIAPMAMGIWNQNAINDFISRIVHVYSSNVNLNSSGTDELLLIHSVRNWFQQERNRLTPLELTIQVITMLNGAETGKNSFDIMNSYIDNIVPNKTLRNSLEVLAYQTLISENPIINKYEMNHYAPELLSDDENPHQSAESINPKKALSLKSHGLVLQETIKGNTIFTHPLFLGFLASNAVIRNGQFQSIFNQPEWAGKETALNYLTHSIDISQYIDYHDVDNDLPLHTKLFSYAHWLRDCKPASIWRPQILKRLAQILNTDTVPFSVRCKALAALCLSNEKGLGALFNGYLLSGYSNIKILASLGCGYLQEQTSINRLADVLGDQNTSVRSAACMALFAMQREDTLEFTVKILLQADENLRRTAAEMLTLDRFEGHSVLKDGIAHQDILVRRAVVFGLGLLRNKWAYDLLQQLQIQEGQWVVRTAATQALEIADGTDPCIPHKLNDPHLCPWLIQAASTTGEGISPGIQPIPLLLKILDTGTDEEIYGSLEYLSTNISETIIARIYDVMFTHQNQVTEAAFYTLWKMSLSGFELPSSKKYGFQS